MAGESVETSLVKGSDRHSDRQTPDDILRVRLEQVVDSFAMTKNMSKHDTIVRAIGVLDKLRMQHS